MNIECVTLLLLHKTVLILRVRGDSGGRHIWAGQCFQIFWKKCNAYNSSCCTKRETGISIARYCMIFAYLRLKSDCRARHWSFDEVMDEMNSARYVHREILPVYAEQFNATSRCDKLPWGLKTNAHAVYCSSFYHYLYAGTSTYVFS